MFSSYFVVFDPDFGQDQPLKWDVPPKPSISVSSMVGTAPVPSPNWKGETLSVVLPCAYEGEYASKTVESVPSCFKGWLEEREFLLGRI